MRHRNRTVGILLALLLAGVSAPCLVAAENRPDVLVFYRDECNDCRHMDEVLDELLEIYPELSVRHIEENEPGAADLMWALSTEYGIFPTKFPVLFAGEHVIVGVGRDKELLLRSAVLDCVFNDCPSPLSTLKRDPLPVTTIAIVAAILLAAGLLLLL